MPRSSPCCAGDIPTSPIPLPGTPDGRLQIPTAPARPIPSAHASSSPIFVLFSDGGFAPTRLAFLDCRCSEHFPRHHRPLQPPPSFPHEICPLAPSVDGAGEPLLVFPRGITARPQHLQGVACWKCSAAASVWRLEVLLAPAVSDNGP